MAEIEQFLSKDAEKQVKDLVKLMADLAKNYEKTFQASKKLDEQIKKTSKSTETEKEKRKQLTEIEREEARILKASETTKAKLETISIAANKLLIKEQELLKAKNKLLREQTREELGLNEAAKKKKKDLEELNKKRIAEKAAIIESNKVKKLALIADKAAAKENKILSSAFAKLNRDRSRAAAILKDLIASEKASTREIKNAQRAFDGLDKKVQKANRSARQFQSNVGNYPKLLGASTRAMGGFLAAFGLVGGIQLFVRSITDAFRRIREFDKSIVELSGILGTSRKNLASLEKTIIDVAGSSVKTSSEVAKLATALATLGATENEIKNLLEPVNNLSIGLKASSEEAGELLKGTLNAFGESSTEAQRYADVIAKMRTSTALDFQRISEALGFVAPTAKAVGLTIEELGAKVGILVNNNIRAARAGRLLSSSFARLVGKGLSLEEALEKIRNSQDKVKTSSELFGKESFTLGLILADNKEKTAELTKEFENAGGALKKLVDTELTSIDAQLKLLDSGFERFILTITKGDNFISAAFKRTINDLTDALNWLSDSLGGVDRRFENWKKTIKEANLPTEQLTGNIDQLVVKIEEANEKIAESQKELDKLQFTSGGKILKDQINAEIEKQKINREGFEKQRDFLLSIENDRIDAANAELERLAKIEAERLRMIDVELQKERERQNRLRGIRESANQAELDANRQLSMEMDSDLDELIAKEEQDAIDLNNSLYTINKQRLEKELEDKRTHEEKIDAINEKAFDDLMQRQKDQEDARREIIMASVDLIEEIFTGFQDLRIQQLSDESNALELQRQTQLENAQGDKNKEAQINAQFDKRQAAIKQKQWKAEQNAAITQILIQGVKGAATTIGNVGLPAAFPLLGILAGLVIAQSAFVKAQKPPKFAKGSKGLKQDTHGIVGDAGRELLFMPGGGVALANKETEAVMPKGTVIKTNKETEQILAANQYKASRENDAAIKNYGELAILSHSIAEDRKSILKAVNDRDQFLFNVSKQGVINLSKRNKSGVTTYLSNRFR